MIFVGFTVGRNPLHQVRRHDDTANHSGCHHSTTGYTNSYPAFGIGRTFGWLRLGLFCFAHFDNYILLCIFVNARGRRFCQQIILQ